MDVPLATLLVRPREAFEAAEEPLSVTRAFAFVFVIGCVLLATAVPLYANMASELPVGLAISFVVGGQFIAVPAWIVVGLLTSISLNIVFWVVIAAIIHVVARVAGGDGRFRRLFVFVGWAHAPYLIMLPVLAVLVAVTLATAPDATLGQVLYGVDTFGGEGLATFNGEGLMDARSWLLWAVTCWIGYLWAGAIEVAYDLPRRRALGVAVTLTAVSLGLTYVSP